MGLNLLGLTVLVSPSALVRKNGGLGPQTILRWSRFLHQFATEITMLVLDRQRLPLLHCFRDLN